MRSFLRIGAAIAATALLSLAACVQSTAPPGSAGTTAPSRGQALAAIADTAAAVADGLGQAPPATLSRTTIDERYVHFAFKAFERALTFIDVMKSSGDLPRNSQRARSVQAGGRIVQRSLNAASAAQRAGNASTYTSALREAKAALTALQISLVQ